MDVTQTKRRNMEIKRQKSAVRFPFKRASKIRRKIFYFMPK